MTEQVFEEIKNAMSVISMLQLRKSTFRKELEFFNLKRKEVCREPTKNTLYIGAFKRLEHEVGFLCVDTYSLYQGIQKKKSLYSKIVKQNGQLLSKIDKTQRDRENYELYTLDSDGEILQLAQEEDDDLINRIEEKAYKSREALKQDFGITSHKHDDLDEWIDKILDDKILSQLEQYRKEFAHRLDSLDNLKRELSNRQPQDIKEMLDTVSEVLDSYYKCFQNILVYTTSQHYSGMTGLRYDSLSRLKLADFILRKEKANNDRDTST